MKKTVECVYCYVPVELEKEPFVHNPINGRYKHLSCLLNVFTSETSTAMVKILHEEALGEKKWLKDFKEKKFEQKPN